MYFCSTERFLSKVVEKYGTLPVSTDGGTWYPQACRFLKLQHHIHSSFEKAWLKEQFNILKIELKGLMTIFLVGKRTIHFIM